MRGYGALTAHGGRATAGADDVYAVGPPRVVLPHLEMDSTRKRSMRRTRGSWRKSMRLCSSRKHGRSSAEHPVCWGAECVVPWGGGTGGGLVGQLLGPARRMGQTLLQKMPTRPPGPSLPPSVGG